MKRVTLYTKPGCHLCDAAKDVIENVRRGHAFEFEIKDILEDDEGFAKYELDIPVILVDGIEVARHRLSRVDLEKALH